jgi:nucleoside-diphosphate-sugar epimerase
LKKILITGESSYIGGCLKKWLGNYPDRYLVKSINLRNNSWTNEDFSKYDVVLHAAGIAHVSSDPKMEESYYKVNRDLTIETASKANEEKVKQFIFLSSIIVYGDGCSDRSVIDLGTSPTPSNFYGNSKLQAEEGIRLLNSDCFKVVILRLPMIYGKGSRGNYRKLAELARKLPMFPDIENQRSMLHIDNLCEFIRLMIDNEERGLFFPQNSEYVKTSDMVRMIANIHGKNIKMIRTFNIVIRLLGLKVGLINKVFGNLVYDMKISNYKENYRIWDLKDSIRVTEWENRE